MMQGSCTSLSDVDDESRPLSPDHDYSKAAGNVAPRDMSDSYLCCGSHVKPFTAFDFDTPPADILLHTDNKRPTTSTHLAPSTGRQGSGRSVSSDEDTDEVVSGLSAGNDDDYSSSAAQDLSQHSPDKSSRLPRSRMSSTGSSDSGRDGEDVADCSISSFRQNTAQSIGAVECFSKSSSIEPPISPSHCSAALHSAKESPSSDSEYMHVLLTQRPFPAELYGKAAPLPPE